MVPLVVIALRLETARWLDLDDDYMPYRANACVRIPSLCNPALHVTTSKANCNNFAEVQVNMPTNG